MDKDTDVDWQTRHDIKVAGQVASLAVLGFGPAFEVGGGSFGFGGTQMASCQTCGAAVRLEPFDPEDVEAAKSQPVYRHFMWHEVSR